MISRRSLLAAGGAVPLAAAAPRPPEPPIVSRIVVEAGRIWTPVMIGDAGPFAFIFDTGASVSAIDPRLAARLGLSRLGRRRMTGIGGAVVVDFYLAKRIVLGDGLRQSSGVFAGIDVAGSSGLLTAGLFTSADSDLDFVRGEWRLWPTGRPNFDGMTHLGTIERRHADASDQIVVEAVLDGQRLRLIVDTGAPGELLLFPHVVKRSGLWNDARPFAPERLRGIGGAAGRLGRVVRAQRLDVGPFAFDAPLVWLHDPGDSVDLRYDGLLGLPVIERLDLSTEVAKGRLWARANGRAKPRENAGQSGMWLDRDGGGDGTRARIAAVSPGSPAAEAGLKISDVVVGIDDWRAYIRRFAAPPGTAVGVLVETPGGPVLRTVTLRAYL